MGLRFEIGIFSTEKVANSHQLFRVMTLFKVSSFPKSKCDGLKVVSSLCWFNFYRESDKNAKLNEK